MASGPPAPRTLPSAALAGVAVRTAPASDASSTATNVLRAIDSASSGGRRDRTAGSLGTLEHLEHRLSDRGDAPTVRAGGCGAVALSDRGGSISRQQFP